MPLDLGGDPELLPASSAWLAIRNRTGIPVSRPTFYRWLNNGSVHSVRLGLKVYVPMSTIDTLVKKSGKVEAPPDDAKSTRGRRGAG